MMEVVEHAKLKICQFKTGLALKMATIITLLLNRVRSITFQTLQIDTSYHDIYSRRESRVSMHIKIHTTAKTRKITKFNTSPTYMMS